MKTLLFNLIVILLLSSCQKQTTAKIDICHFDKESGTFHTISINENAWSSHQAHGDMLGACNQTAVTICGNEWMIKNLDVTTYSDGTIIPEVTNSTEWANLTTGAWCYFENNSANGPIYGKLYNWYAVNDPRGLAPAGWHIPSDNEWTALSDCLGGEAIAGGKMKETGYLHWLFPNTGATNSTGFTALPGSFRFSYGDFSSLGNNGWWWSSTSEDVIDAGISAWYRNIDYNGTYIGRTNGFKKMGYSVRCIKNSSY